jgi:hypothetical protein
MPISALRTAKIPSLKTNPQLASWTMRCYPFMDCHPDQRIGTQLADVKEPLTTNDHHSRTHLNVLTHRL